jgi:hypothetical protein
MERVIRFFANLLDDDGYFRFQNELAQAMYGALGQGCANSDNEVGLVSRLVDAVNGKEYKGIRLYSRKIHGPRSYVQFNYQDKPVTKELADSVFITVVTRGRERLVQRVCFVQNKVAKDRSWTLDGEQLYLLKNFPLFSGTQGIFRGASDVVFKNLGKSLGAFGLLMDPGEMMVVSAPLLAEMACGRSALKVDDVSVADSPGTMYTGTHASPGFPWLPWHPMMLDELYHDLFHLVRKFGPHFPLAWLGASPQFLGSTIFMRDLHDHARNWTLCNIGEYCYVFAAVLDGYLENFAARLLRAAGAQQFFDFNQDLPEMNADMAVFIAQVDVGKE